MDDRPVRFAIVEFADGVTAERACIKLKNLTIGGRRVELEMCVPGQSVPEAFSRQMTILVRIVFHLFAGYVNHVDTIVLFTGADNVIGYKGCYVYLLFVFLVLYDFLCKHGMLTVFESCLNDTSLLLASSYQFHVYSQ